MKTGTIAIVGRPNVGKSTLFNRIAGERLSIVEDIPGVTRDRIYSSADWTGNHFQIIDTGGIQLEDQPFQEEIRAQVQIAIEEADVILMVCNGKSGMSDDDRYIAGLLQRSRKPIVLAVNQIDDTTKMMNLQVKCHIFSNFFSFSLTYILIFGTIGASIFDLKGDYFENFSNRYGWYLSRSSWCL